MAQLSGFSDAAALSLTDFVYIAQNGIEKKLTGQQLVDFVAASGSGSGSSVPYFVPDGTTYTLGANLQATAHVPITVAGMLQPDGLLVFI